MSTTYVFRFVLPIEIEKKIQHYLLGSGTKLCQLVKPFIETIPENYTWWSWQMNCNNNGYLLCHRFGLGWSELQLVYILSKLLVETDEDQIDLYNYKINIIQASIEARFMLFIYRMNKYG